MVIKKEFNCIEDIVDDALSIDCDFGFSFITKYTNASIILKELFKQEELTPFLIDISDESFDGYDKEYIISVNNDGEVFCEKFYRKDRYIIPDNGVNYILKDCTDECISHLYKYEDCIFIDVVFEDETESCGCCKWGDDVSFVASCDDAFTDNCCVTPCRDGNGIVTGYITISI